MANVAQSLLSLPTVQAKDASRILLQVTATAPEGDDTDLTGAAGDGGEPSGQGCAAEEQLPARRERVTSRRQH